MKNFFVEVSGNAVSLDPGVLLFCPWIMKEKIFDDDYYHDNHPDLTN